MKMKLSWMLAPAMVRQQGMRGAIGASILSLGLLDAMLAGIMAFVLRRADRELQRKGGEKE